MDNLKKILIVGLFVDPDKAPVTQAVELARVLKKGYEVLTVSRFKNRLLRIVDIVWFICFNNRKFDSGIVQFYSGNSLIWQSVACTLIKWFRKRLVITIHGGAVPERIIKYPGRYLPVLSKADVITCPSPFMIENLAIYSFKPRLIENIIQLQEYPFFNKRDLKPVLLWMRAFSAIYNPVMAVNVVRQLKQQYADVKMFMGGPDLGMLKEIEQLIYEYGLQENIELVGFMDMEKKKLYAQQASIYISTNRVDNAPVTFLEMWAMGLPVVSTNVGGIPYFVRNGETAMLVDDDDHVAMADKVSSLLSSKEMAQRLTGNAKEQVKKYSEDAVFKKWQLLLNEL